MVGIVIDNNGTVYPPLGVIFSSSMNQFLLYFYVFFLVIKTIYTLKSCLFDFFIGKAWHLIHLQLTVSDVNDESPQWTMEPFPYLAAVSPQALAGTCVYRLHAADLDEGANGEVEYFLLEGNGALCHVDGGHSSYRSRAWSFVYHWFIYLAMS